MQGITFGIIGDPHFQLNATSRLDNVIDTMERKFLFCFEEAKKRDLKAIILTGDLFHIKTASKIKHQLVKRMIQIFKKSPCPLYTIIGNHDISNNRLDSILSQPIGVLLESEVVELLDDHYFQSDDTLVRLVGVHYTSDLKFQDFNIEKTHEDFLGLVTHWFFDRGPGDFWGSRVLGMNEINEDINVVINGHDHSFKYLNIRGRLLIQPGAILRGTLAEEDINRVPKFGLLRFEKGRDIHFESVEIPCEESKVVLNVKKKEVEKKEEAIMTDFMNKLNFISKTKRFVDYEDILNEMKISQEVKDKVREYLL